METREIIFTRFSRGLLLVVAVFTNYQIGIIVSLGYLSHLLLDLFDGSDFYPFYPLKYNVRGPIGYLSKVELCFALFLFIIFLII